MGGILVVHGSHFATDCHFYWFPWLHQRLFCYSGQHLMKPNSLWLCLLLSSITMDSLYFFGWFTCMLAVASPEATSYPLWLRLCIIFHFLANGVCHPLTMTLLVSVWVIMQMLASGCMSQDDALQPGDKGMKWKGIKTGLNRTINPSNSTEKHNLDCAHHISQLLKIAALWQTKLLIGLKMPLIHTYHLLCMGKLYTLSQQDRCVGCF